MHREPVASEGAKRENSLRSEALKSLPDGGCAARFSQSGYSAGPPGFML